MILTKPSTPTSSKAARLLESMEDALLRVEQSPEDEDLINAIFRAAHTIKGSAGLFGLDYVVSFRRTTPRTCSTTCAPATSPSAAISLPYSCVCDHMGQLIDNVARATPPTDDLLAHRTP